MASLTKLAICQQACLRMGLQPMASLTDETDEALLLNAIYHDIVQSYYELGLWKFVKKQDPLIHVAGTPQAKWTHAWLLPSDCLFLEMLWVGGSILKNYDLYAAAPAGRYVYCDVPETSVLVADYVFDADAVTWQPSFRHVVISALCELLASGVLEDGERAAYFAQQTEKWIHRAAARDDQQTPTRRLPVNRFLSARRLRSR